MGQERKKQYGPTTSVVSRQELSSHKYGGLGSGLSFVCVCVCVCAGAVPAGGVTHRAALQKGGRIHRGTHTHFYTHTHTHTHSPTHSLSDIFSKRRRQSHAHGRAHRQTTVSVGVDQGATKARGALVHSHTVAHSGGLSKAPREWTKARGGSTGSKTLARVVSRPCEDGSV